MTEATPYTVPKEPGRGRAIALAVLVHAALFAFLWIGVRWQSETPATIEAEVWSPDTREAAPVPVPVKQPEPVKAPEPKPVIKETPKPVTEEPPVKQPDIALEQEKKRKAELEKKRLEQERQAKLKQKAEAEHEAKLQQEQERVAKQKTDEQRVAKEKAEKKKAADEAKRKQQEVEDQKLAKIRDEEMQRITGGVTGTGGTGTAPKSQGGRADSGYAARVAAKIKSNITFNVPESLATNSPVQYQVDLLPDGSVAGIRQLKSSGVPGFDEAVRRAIEKSQPYPKDKSGSVPSSFIGTHKPKDQ
jgi:colicin import membrane protein